MSMTKKEEKKKTSPVFFAAVIVMMAVVFAAQMIIPANLGKLYLKLSENAVEITVTKTTAKAENSSYYTASLEKIAEFGVWADGKTMRNKSIASSLTADAGSITKYNFAVKYSDGSYGAMVIDEKGYVHMGAELYKVSGSPETFISELEAELERWNEE